MIIRSFKHDDADQVANLLNESGYGPAKFNLTVIIKRYFFKKENFLFVLVFLTFFVLLKTNASSENLYIKEIKVLSGHQTNPQIILNYLTLQEGQKIDSLKLKQELNKSYSRLLETGFVYSLNMHLVPNELNKNEIKIIIEIKDEKNNWIFGAGNLYFSFGKINLNGEGKYWLAYLGSNLNGITYFDPLLSPKNKLSVISSIYTYYSSTWQRHINTSFIDLRKKINAYSFIGNKLSLDKSTANDQIIGLSLYHYWNDSDSLNRPSEGLFYRSDLELFRDYTAEQNFFRLSTGGQTFIPITNGLVYDFKSYFGLSNGWLSNLKLYNIAHIEGLRGGGLENWLGHSYFLFNNEIIYPRTKNSLLEGVLFLDIGRTWLSKETIALENLNVCYGAGLRGYILPPINVNFRVEYGISQKGIGALLVNVWQSL